jgi:hypothetical protein
MFTLCMFAKSRRLIAGLLVVCISGLGLPLPAQAGMVATDSAMGSADRERMSSVLERTDVRAQLEAYGVNVSEAKARVAALTDNEAAELAARMDQLPAAGVYQLATGVLLIALLVFLISLRISR